MSHQRKILTGNDERKSGNQKNRDTIMFMKRKNIIIRKNG